MIACAFSSFADVDDDVEDCDTSVFQAAWTGRRSRAKFCMDTTGDGVCDCAEEAGAECECCW